MIKRLVCLHVVMAIPFVLAACGSSTPVSSEQPSDSLPPVAQTSQQIPPTVVPTSTTAPTSTSTPAPTTTPIPTAEPIKIDPKPQPTTAPATPTPMPTSTSTPEPTSTPLTTLTPAEKKIERIMSEWVPMTVEVNRITVEAPDNSDWPEGTLLVSSPNVVVIGV